jgi:hypothetical protein
LLQLSDVLFGKAVARQPATIVAGAATVVISRTSDKKPDENRPGLGALAARFGRTASLAAHYVACTSIVTVLRYDTVLSAKFHFGEVILGK